MVFSIRHYLFIVICYVFSTINLKAEQLVESNGYKIHYNAFNSAMLTPDIAKQYGILRSKSLGVINISVIAASDQSVLALVEGHAKNNLSQMQELKFKKVIEGKAIYFIATFNFADKEHLNFTIYVVPDNENSNAKVSFSQQFFVG